jgi:hypothetical protein
MKREAPEEANERGYVSGHRAATMYMIRHLLREILPEPHASPEVTLARLVTEREQTVLTLRSICEEFGDNDWPENLHMPDIIEKHLARHLR